MGSAGSPSILFCHGRVSNALPFIYQANCNPHKLSERYSQLATIPQPLMGKGVYSRGARFLRAPLRANDPTGSADEDGRAIETVLKLYAAIKHKNLQELSDIIGDECRCVCNFVSLFQPFHGKKQVLDFFSNLIINLGNNIEFIVQPTWHDGMNVGVSWTLECNKTHVPLGKGFSFYMLHRYQGKLVIRNMEMFMEPLLHIEPFRLKVMGFMMILFKKRASNRRFMGKGRALGMMISIIVIAALLFLLKHS